jgi:RNA polymerase sigma-70 factor (ECF subfamily)
MRVWDKADTYLPDQGKVVTWLARIARNRSVDMIRRRNVRAEGHSTSWAEVEASDLPDTRLVENSIELSQRQQWVRQAIAQLPEEQRAALGLAYFKGYSHPQIAEALGEPLGTVKTRIRLAMQKLAKLLSDEAEAL